MAKLTTSYKMPALEHLRDKPLRVAAFVRDSDYESAVRIQIEHYTKLVDSFPKWTLCGCYAGRGKKSAPEKDKTGYAKLISDCKNGKIDLIIAKNVSLFSRNLQTAIDHIRDLKTLEPPVGVYFEENNLYTLDDRTSCFLSLFALMAEEESNMKNRTMHPPSIGSFSNLLKRVRTKKGMTQQEVADAAGISQRQYQRFESEERKISNASFRIAMSVCKALEIFPDMLLNDQIDFLNHKGKTTTHKNK